ncbi:MAG: RNA polymerase sigma factor [Candidatus Dormibacteria bacterium]
MLLMHNAAAPVSRPADGSDLDFEAGVAPLLEPCFRLALVMLADPGEAEDAVQEAVTKAWRHLDQLPEGAELRPWLLGIVANECRMARRRRWWTVVRLADPPTVGEQGIDDLEGTELRRAIRRLPRRLGLVIALRYYLDLPLEEVALTAGIPLGTAKSRLHRATRELRKELEHTEVRAA